jgi:anti-anti-sigma regulatory factor
MPIKTKQLAGLCEVTFEGDITLPYMAEVREGLLEALNGADRISLDMAKVSQLDLSCLQVFCAMHKTSISREKKIFFSVPLPAAAKEIMERTGYWRNAGCHRKMNGDCLLGGATYG